MAAEAVTADLAYQAVTLTELHIDRASLSSQLVRERPSELTISCKAWPVWSGERSPKTAFQLDWEAGTIRCPNEIRVPFRPSEIVHFPAEECIRCPLRAQCTTSEQGRSVSVHPDGGCSSNCTSARRQQLDGPRCGNTWQSSTAWPTAATRSDNVPATKVADLFDLPRPPSSTTCR
jgi:hypothetical protein